MNLGISTDRLCYIFALWSIVIYICSVASENIRLDKLNFDFESHSKYHKIGGIRIQNEANRLSDIFSRLAKDEMGTQALKKKLEVFDFKHRANEIEQDIKQLTSSVYNKTKSFGTVLKNLRQLVSSLYKFHLKDPITLARDCCHVKETDSSTFGPRHIMISGKNSCELLPPNFNKQTFNPGRNLTGLFKSSYKYIKIIKWLFFLSTNGLQSILPSYNFGGPGKCRGMAEMLHRQEYVHTIDKKPKHVLLLINHGTTLTPHTLHIAKALSRNIIDSLSDTDKVGVVAISNEVKFASRGGASCLNSSLISATLESRELLKSFIDSLEEIQETADRSMGFEAAFQMLETTLHNSQAMGENTDRVLLIFISPGGVEQLEDPKNVLTVVRTRNRRLRNAVKINTAQLSDGRPVVFAKEALLHIAEQNFKRVNLGHLEAEYSNTTMPPIKKGVSVMVNRSTELNREIDLLLSLEDDGAAATDELVYSMPHKDPVDDGLIVTVSTACQHTHTGLPTKDNSTRPIIPLELIGVVGLDIPVSELAESVTYYRNTKDGSSYAFLIHTSGNIISHPALGRPTILNYSPMHVHITHLENYPNFDKVVERILTEVKGNATVTSGTLFVAHYSWMHVKQSPYIVVIKYMRPDYVFTHPNTKLPEKDQVLYHRLDLVPPRPQMCSHFLHTATDRSSVVFLSPAAFEESVEHLQRQESRKDVNMYTLYFTDEARILSSNIVKKTVRNSVTLLTFLDEHWVRRWSSLMAPYIIRRYAATQDGVMRMHPGLALDSDYDPTSSDWYRKAVASAGRLEVQSPRLDKISGEYVVTFSQALLIPDEQVDGKPVRVAAVLAMDVTLGYLYHQILDLLPICQYELSCFLMDDTGYLVAHRSLVNATEQKKAKLALQSSDGDIVRDTVEAQHVTWKETQLAYNMLTQQYNKGFWKRKRCHSYLDRTTHQSYLFNLSMKSVISNHLVGQDKHPTYEIAVVPNTNLFFGIRNQSNPYFCPYNTKDRNCMTCDSRGADKGNGGCESPCHCSLLTDLCHGGLLPEEEYMFTEPCESDSESPRPKKPVRGIEGCIIEEAELPDCFESRCSTRTSWRDCFAVQGCAWCEYAGDSKTQLSSPFCSSQLRCSGGVLKPMPPSCAHVLQDLAKRGEEWSMRSAPVGPVAGGLLGCVLVLGLAVYCYRQRVHREREEMLAQARALQIQPGDELLPEAGPSHDNGHGYVNESIMLATFGNPAHISPYRVSTDYRRPAPTTAESSDPGYSTMKDDSERASLPQDPLSDGSEAGSVPGAGARLRMRMRYELGMVPYLRPAPCRRGASRIPRIPPPPSSVSSRSSSRRSRSSSPRRSAANRTSSPESSIIDKGKAPIRGSANGPKILRDTIVSSDGQTRLKAEEPQALSVPEEQVC